MNRATPTSNNANARNRRMAWVLGAAAAMGGLDLALTMLLMHTTGMYESNPIAVAIVRHGAWALAAYKVGSMSLTTAFLWLARATRLGRVGGWVSLAVLCLLTLHWAHVLGVVVATGGNFGTDVGEGVQWVCFAGQGR